MNIPSSGDSLITENISLARLTSWQIGGNAEFFAQPRSLIELRSAIQWAKSRAIDVTVLGGGTNVLISDQGIAGLTISLKNFARVESRVEGDRLLIECDAGAGKGEILKIFLKHRLAPALFLAGLPGEVGGGVVMNAGVSEEISPREFNQIVDWIDVLRDDQICRLNKSELQWAYRHCEGWRPGVVVRVGISWLMDRQEDILSKVKRANQVRLSKQPLDQPSCGSVFVNPPGDKAGRLIETCGLKGYQVGKAKISEKHANFIVNLGQATALDVRSLIAHIQKTVLDRTGIQLKTEVVLLGRWT